MSKVSIKGNPSGTGNFSIEAPNSNTDRTLNLPDEAGTVLTSGGPIDVDDSAPADSVAIDSNGNVGIGTSSPDQLLDISNNTAATVRFSSTDPALAAAESIGALEFYTNDSSNPGVAAKISAVAENANGEVGLSFETGAGGSASEAVRIDRDKNLQFNSGYGSVATAYGCRAWVNFDGTGTVSIRESGNVSSITDNGTGRYSVNFTTSMPDANYAAYGKSLNGSAGSGGLDGDEEYFSIARSYTANSFKIGLRTNVSSGFGSVDSIQNTYAVFR